MCAAASQTWTQVGEGGHGKADWPGSWAGIQSEMGFDQSGHGFGWADSDPLELHGWVRLAGWEKPGWEEGCREPGWEEGWEEPGSDQAEHGSEMAG